MSLSIGIVVFLFGLIIGSFLNVVIYRFNTSRGLNGRSACFSCNKKLTWQELIPIFSFLFQKGRCKSCHSKISWQYPLIELFSGLTFLVLFLKFAPLLEISFPAFLGTLVYYFALFSILTVILVYDLRHMIIPNRLVYLFALLSFFQYIIVLLPYNDAAMAMTWPTLAHILSGPLLALPFAMLWVVSKGKWIGLGDAKLALGIGFLVGFTSGLAALLLSFWIGAVVSIFMLLVETRKTLKTEVPFAPFIILGLAIVFFFDLALPDIIHFFEVPWL